MTCSGAVSRAEKISSARRRAAALRALLVMLLGMLLAAATPLPGAAASSKLPLILDRPAGMPRSLFPFQSYGAESGLDNLAVRRIAQDRTGFLWVGTEDGLYRYDGERFTRFDSRNGLPSTWINDLLSTPEGQLWACTPEGPAVMSGKNFEPISAKSSGLPAGPCHALAYDSGKSVWVAHADGLFYESNGKFRQIRHFPADRPTAVAASPEPSKTVYAAAKGEVIRIDDHQISRRYRLSTEGLVDSIVVDGSARVWAQSRRKLFCLWPGAAEFRDMSADLPPLSSRGILSVDRAGRLWVPTDEGVSCRVGNGWRHFSSGDGLYTETNRHIFEDREGSFWIGSIGVHRLIGRGAWISWTRAQGLPSDTIWDIYRSKKGDLWVATDRGLSLATPGGWRTVAGTERTVVRCIHEDPGGKLWLGLVPAAVMRYDPATGQISRYAHDSGVVGHRVLRIEGDAEGQIWAATDGAGLLRFRAEENRFVREHVPGGTPQETFRYILRDKHNRLWATGEGGLLLRNGGKWHRFGRQDGLLRNNVSYITQLSSGEFWLSYFEPLGIVRFVLDEGKLKILEHLDQQKGLSSKKVYLLGQDLESRLWVGTGNGIDVFSPQGVLHFSKTEGLAGDDIDAMAFLVEPNGSVFVGTSSGLSMYRSDMETERIQAPTPVLLSAGISDHPLEPGADNSVPHKFNTLTAEFAVLSFTHESQIEYSSRLIGLEQDWHRSRLREARYPGLAPGKYVYEIRARFGSGPWGPPASISFEIRQPWWFRWPAILTWLILIASAGYGGIRWRLNRLRERTQRLEKLVSERTMELAMANADLERLCITDPLTGLKNRRFLEFSIVEDVARIRRTFQFAQGGWESLPEDFAHITFLVIDIDHFKLVNDRFGHAAGDQVLHQMASVVSSAVRESDTTIRWGGEEFLVVGRNPRGNDSASLAERVRKQVEAAQFDVGDGQSIRLTCSIGFAAWPFFRHEPEALNWQEVLDLADRCLYLVKNSGRNAWMGVTARSDYRGQADYTVLNDFRTAESIGVITIHSSSAAGFRACPPFGFMKSQNRAGTSPLS